MTFVLDCSIAIGAALPDEMIPLAVELMERASREGAFVPAHWPLEVANALVMAVKRHRIDEEFARAALGNFAAIELAIDEETSEAAWSAIPQIAFRSNLTTYDAAYLELASRRGLPLATLDARLVAAARAAGLQVLGV